ncbi:MAG: glycoside hydrolase family 16 protein [Deltaproteobacteria bacterium]|nr:glycoside hydrolase family 16 protein [Deltaproteobacteria bacterium]
MLNPLESTSPLKPSPSLSPSPSPSPQVSSSLEPMPTVTPTPPPILDPLAKYGEPEIETNFNKGSDLYFFGYALSPGGAGTIGLFDNEAEDDRMAQLLLPANTPLSGPGGSSQLESYKKNYLYGTYVARFKPGSCASLKEGVVSAFFTYYNDGKDYNKNGLVDNSEIDIEILCAEPSTIYMTLWTDYSDDENFLKTTRKLNLKTGEILQTTLGQESKWGLNTKLKWNDDFPDINLFQNYLIFGFTWQPTYVRYFMVVQDQEYELWKYQNKKFIPQIPAYVMFNVWHNATHWHNDLPASKPNQPVKYNVDWFKLF